MKKTKSLSKYLYSRRNVLKRIGMPHLMPKIPVNITPASINKINRQIKKARLIQEYRETADIARELGYKVKEPKRVTRSQLDRLYEKISAKNSRLEMKQRNKDRLTGIYSDALRTYNDLRPDNSYQKPKNATYSSVRKIERKIKQAQLEDRYNQLKDILEKEYDMQIQTPKMLTDRSINALEIELKRKEAGIFSKKEVYYKLKSLLESNGISVKEPKRITDASIRKLQNILAKNGIEAPCYSKDDTGYHEINKDNDDGIFYDAVRPAPGDGGDDEPTRYEDEVIDMYVDFIKLAYDYGHAGFKWHAISGEYHEYNSTVHGYIMDQAQNCLDMLERIGAYDETTKKDIVNNLVRKSYDIYADTEMYLYHYRCVLDIKGEGIAMLQSIERALTEITENRSFTEDEKKRWAEVADFFGEDYGVGYYE